MGFGGEGSWVFLIFVEVGVGSQLDGGVDVVAARVVLNHSLRWRTIRMRCGPIAPTRLRLAFVSRFDSFSFY